MPVQLWPDLDIATPLLHRCIARIGLFPYHNVHCEAPPPTLDVISVALVILAHRFGETSLGLCHPDDKPYDLTWDRWYRRLLFQCMSTCEAAPEPANRCPDDDEHVLQAHKVVEAMNKQRDCDRPKVMIRGDPIIPAQDLPSSRSQYIDGVIPQDQFKSLIKLLLFLQLCAVGFEPGHVCNEPKRLDSATQSVLTAFLDPGVNEGSGITWDAFEAASSGVCVSCKAFRMKIAPLCTKKTISPAEPLHGIPRA